MANIPNKHAGFTLIEIMLVVVLMAISAVAVIMNLPSSREDMAKEQAQRFYYRLQLLNEDAILNGKDFGVRIEQQKGVYSYLQLESTGWSVLESKNYKETKLPENITLTLELGSNVWSQNESFFSNESLFDEEMFAEYEKEKKIKPPELFVLSSGEITPFRLSISPIQDKDKGWFIDGKESGEIELYHARDLLDEANTK